MIVSPRSRFQQNASDMKEMAKLVNQEWFHRALEQATLWHVGEITTGVSGDLTSSAVGFHRIAGAKDFVSKLLTLHETIVERASKPAGNLNHQV